MKALKITQIIEKHPDEWVVAEVLKVDKAEVPVAGRVLYHGYEKEHIFESARRYQDQNPKAKPFIFFTGDPIPEGIKVALPAT